MSSIDQQFVEFIVKSLVGNPDAVTIERCIDEKGVLLELTVDPDDLGRVIGKRGATAQSLRTLLRALGTKNDARYNLKIVDNGFNSRQSGNEAQDDDREDYSSEDTGSKNDSGETESNPQDSENHSSVVNKTRKELEELDDLDL